MAKGQFVQDTFEKLAELGTSTAKKTVKSVAQTMSPAKILEQVTGQEAEAEADTKKNKETKKNGQNHTTLDFDELQKKYAEQDKQKEQELRHRLFQLVKEGEKEAYKKSEQKEEERKQLEAQEDQAKKKKEEEKKAQEQQEDVPHGKERKSIFSTKKKMMEKHAEVKPATGKQ